MFFTAYLPLFLLPISALQIPSILAPFYEPHLDDSLLLSNDSLIPTQHDLLKRDGNCPISFNSCSTFAAADAGACCTQGSFCTTDHAKNVSSIRNPIRVLQILTFTDCVLSYRGNLHGHNRTSYSSNDDDDDDDGSFRFW
jgi:hypothetical protein